MSGRPPSGSAFNLCLYPSESHFLSYFIVIAIHLLLLFAPSPVPAPSVNGRTSFHPSFWSRDDCLCLCRCPFCPWFRLFFPLVSSPPTLYPFYTTHSRCTPLFSFLLASALQSLLLCAAVGASNPSALINATQDAKPSTPGVRRAHLHTPASQGGRGTRGTSSGPKRSEQGPTGVHQPVPPVCADMSRPKPALI